MAELFGLNTLTKPMGYAYGLGIHQGATIAFTDSKYASLRFHMDLNAGEKVRVFVKLTTGNYASTIGETSRIRIRKKIE